MAEGFFSGFAQGFSSSYGRGMQDRRLRDQLGFEQQKFQWQKTQEQQQIDIQRQQLEQQKAYQGGELGLRQQEFAHQKTQDQLLIDHQKYSDMLQTKQVQIEQEKQKLATIGTIQQTMFNPDLTKNQRAAALRSFALGIGMDLKSEQFKQLDMLTNDPEITPEDRKNIGALVTHKLVNEPPEAVDYLVKIIKNDPAKGIPLLNELQKGPDLGSPVKVLGPDGKPRFEYGNVAASQGMTPAPAEPAVTLINKTESKREELYTQSEFDRYNKEIRPAGEHANTDNQLIAGLEAVTKDGRFKTGAFAGSRQFLGQVLELGGVNPNDIPGVGDPMNAEVFKSLSQQMATKQAQDLSRLTNLGLQLVQGNVPDLSKTPEGNAVLIEIRKRANDRSIQIQHKADEYMHKYKTLSPDGLPSLDDYITKLDNENPVINKALEDQIKSKAKIGAAMTWDQAADLWNKGLTEGKKAMGEAVDAGTAAVDKGTAYIDSPKFNSISEAQAAARAGKIKSGTVVLVPWPDGTTHQVRVK